MKKRVINGLLVSSDKFDTICFDRSESNSIEYNFDSKSHVLRISYPDGAITNDIKYKGIQIIENSRLQVLGCFNLMPTVIVNNYEYIIRETPYKGIYQYLTNSELTEKGQVIHNGCVFTVLTDKEVDPKHESVSEPVEPEHRIYKDELLYTNRDIVRGTSDAVYPPIEGLGDYNFYHLDPTPPEPDEPYDFDYVSWYNSFGNVYVRKLSKDDDNYDESLPQYFNVYMAPFDGQRLRTNDKSISGMTDEFALNDVIVEDAFINKLRKLYPEIDFWTNEANKDQSNYNEWIHYEFTLSTINSRLFNNIVRESSQYGRWWHTTTDFNFEYITNDLPTCLARRDKYRVGKFLNEVHTFLVPVGNQQVQCSLFWDRNELEDAYQQQTNDSNGFSQFTYRYTGRILFCNLETKAKKVTQIENVIFSLLNRKGEDKEIDIPIVNPPDIDDKNKVGLIL